MSNEHTTSAQASILKLFSLEGKVALVTGAASGLGAAIAVALADAGAELAVHGNRRPATQTATAIGDQRRGFPGRPLFANGSADSLRCGQGAVRSDRHPCQQCGNDHACGGGRDPPGRLDAGSPSQPDERFSTLATRRTRSLCARSFRQDREHCVAAEFSGRYPRACLCSFQRGNRAAYQSARE